MRNIAKKFFKNSIFELVSRRNQRELVSSMIKNNLKGYHNIHRYKTDINPKMDKFETYDEVISYISNLDYTNLLYFYTAGLMELTLFEHHLLERNTEIKEATRNAEMLKVVLSGKSSNQKLSPNNYINIYDIKSVVLNVFCDMISIDSINEDERVKNVLSGFVNNFEKYFKNIMSPIDVFTELIYLDSCSVSEDVFNNGIDRLNANISRAGGILTNVKISKGGVDELIKDLSNIIPDEEVREQITVLKEVNDLYDLGYEYLPASSVDNNKIESLENYLDEKANLND